MLYIYILYIYAVKIIYRLPIYFPIFIPFEIVIIIWGSAHHFQAHPNGFDVRGLHGVSTTAAEEQHHNFLRLDQPISSARLRNPKSGSRCLHKFHNRSSVDMPGKSMKITQVIQVTVTEHYLNTTWNFPIFSNRDEKSLCIQLVFSETWSLGDPHRVACTGHAIKVITSAPGISQLWHEVARSFFFQARQKTFHSHPMGSSTNPSQNANENGRRIYICFMMFQPATWVRRFFSDCLVALDRSFIYCSMGISDLRGLACMGW